MREHTRGIAGQEVVVMIRVLRAVVVTALFVVPFALDIAARAQDCPVLDPTCTIDGTVDSTHHTIDHTANTAKGTADDAVSGARGTVGGLMGGETPPPGGGGGSDPGDGGGHGGSGRGPGGHGGGHHGAQSTTSSTTVAPPIFSPAPGSVGGPAKDVAPGANGQPTPSTVTQIAAGVLGGVAVMLVLLGAIAAFLTVQDRLDRRDPKLLPASLDSDRVLFT